LICVSMAIHKVLEKSASKYGLEKKCCASPKTYV